MVGTYITNIFIQLYKQLDYMFKRKLVIVILVSIAYTVGYKHGYKNGFEKGKTRGIVKSLKDQGFSYKNIVRQIT